MEETYWETGVGSSFSAEDRSVIATALQRLLQTFTTSCSEFADIIRSFVDDIESSRAAATEARREVEQQKGLVYIAKKSASAAFNNVAGLRERVAFLDNRKAQLLANISAFSGQIARETAELSQAQNTISTQSKELSKISKFKTLIKRLQDNFALYGASGEDKKGELAKGTAESTQFVKLFDIGRTQLVNLR